MTSEFGTQDATVDNLNVDTLMISREHDLHTHELLALFQTLMYLVTAIKYIPPVALADKAIFASSYIHRE